MIPCLKGLIGLFHAYGFGLEKFVNELEGNGGFSSFRSGGVDGSFSLVGELVQVR